MVDDEEGTVMSAAEVTGGGKVTAAEGVMADENGSGAMVPDFPALTAQEMGTGSQEYRRIRVPPHRLTPLRTEWTVIMQPVVEHLMLQIR